MRRLLSTLLFVSFFSASCFSIPSAFSQVGGKDPIKSQVFEMLYLFSNGAQLKINSDKTELLYLGTHPQTGETVFQIKKLPANVKNLYTYFTEQGGALYVGFLSFAKGIQLFSASEWGFIENAPKEAGLYQENFDASTMAISLPYKNRNKILYQLFSDEPGVAPLTYVVDEFSNWIRVDHDKKMDAETPKKMVVDHFGILRIDGEFVVDLRSTHAHVTPEELMEDIVQVYHPENYKPIYTADATPEEILSSVQHFESQIERVAEIRKELEGRIYGQPEVIDRIVQVELEKAVFGKGTRKKPIVAAYLMGLPGTGKDTSVEAWMDVLHGKEEAHLEHTFRMPIVRDKEGLNRVLGSGTGYVGSNDVPDFIKFLVLHSGGRYGIYQTKGEEKERPFVIDNEKLDTHPLPEGAVRVYPPADYFDPEDAVVFINEFHQWDKEMKTVILNQALEKGLVEIKNPGKGVSQIYVPVNYVIASNEGIELVASRESDGTRFGDPLVYEQMMEKHQTVFKDILELKRTLEATNGKDSGSDKTQLGISEELLNRIPTQALVLMRPLSHTDLKRVIVAKLTSLASRFFEARSAFKGTRFEWSDHLIELILRFQQVDEDGARPVESKVAGLVQETLMSAILEGSLKPEAGGQTLIVDVSKNEDGTSQLLVHSKEETTQRLLSDRLIDFTLSEKAKNPMSDEALEELLTLEGRLKKHIVGAGSVIAKVARNLVVSEEKKTRALTPETAKTPATKMVFVGLSSTGKTETAKAIARELYGSERALEKIDFNQVTTIQDIKDKILGSTIGGKAVKSEFMKHYDRHNGKFVIVLDEAASGVTSAQVLMALYDLLDEAVIDTFSDKKARVMTNVTIIITGNAGIEWFKDIPRDIPEIEQQIAFQEVYEKAIGRPEFIRQKLEEYFTEAFLNRIGERNVYFFPPHTFRSRKELAMLKLNQTLKGFKNREGARSYDVVFRDTSEYEKFVETVDLEGWVLREQGRSLNRMVSEEFEKGLDYLLLENLVPDGAQVVLSEKSRQEEKDQETGLKKRTITYSVSIPSQNKELELALDGKARPDYPELTREDRVLVAFHEAGHELVRHILLGDKYEPLKITIVPGVAEIAGRWIHYAGLASSDKTEAMSITREVVLSEMAVLIAGHTAQEIVTKGGVSDAGKSNDMERATLLAQNAILKWGLSKEIGLAAVPEGMGITEALLQMSDSKRTRVEAEVDQMIQEAKRRATRVLIENFSLRLLPMGIELAEKGTLYQEAIDKYYVRESELSEADRKEVETYRGRNGLISRSRVLMAVFRYFYRNHKTRDGKFLPVIPMPEKLADISEITEKKRQEAIREVQVPHNLPITKSCLGFLTSVF